MEYERALFRVYDRIMEDITSAAPPADRDVVMDTPMCCLPLPGSCLTCMTSSSANAHVNAGASSIHRNHRLYTPISRDAEEGEVGERQEEEEEEEEILTENYLVDEEEGRPQRRRRRRQMNPVLSVSSTEIGYGSATATSGAGGAGGNSDDVLNSSSSSATNAAISAVIPNVNSMERGYTYDNDNDSENDKINFTRCFLYNVSFFCFLFGLFQLLTICALHHTYVTTSSERASSLYKSTNYGYKKANPTLTSMYASNCLSYALSSRKDLNFPEDWNRNNTSGQPLLLRSDEILQIIVLDDMTGYNPFCDINNKLSCSRVHYDKPNSSTPSLFQPGNDEDDGIVDFRFSMSEALLYLDDRFIYEHNVTLVNVTLTSTCLTVGNDFGHPSSVQKLSQFWSSYVTGYTVPIINQAMNGILNVTNSGSIDFVDGFLFNNHTGAHWSWTKESLSNSVQSSGMTWAVYHFPWKWFSRKFVIVLLSYFSFFLITSITSLIVRILTTSGVVLMFPFFNCLRRCGLSGASERILTLSYPWIGLAIHRSSHPPPRSLQNRHSITNHMVKHMITSQTTKVVLFYLMYEACQTAWSVLLYGSKTSSQGMPILLFGMAMIWEYFSMIFMRSALSIYFFPKCVFILYLAYHIYFYSVPYGYFDEAVSLLFVFSVQAMMYCLLVLEPRVHRNGLVSLECPRELYTALPWHDWSAAFPADWTLYLPLNTRNIPLHDINVNESEVVSQSMQEESSDHDDDDSSSGDSSDYSISTAHSTNDNMQIRN